MFLGQGYGVFGYDGFSGGGVCGDEDRVSRFEVVDGAFLEDIQFEGELVG